MGKKTAVVWGYFTKNLGDDLMLKAFLNATRGKYSKVYINSYKQHKQYYSDWGVTVVSLNSLIFRVINKILYVLKLPELYFWFSLKKNTDFIMLGGSLFAESNDSRTTKHQIRNLEFAIDQASHAYVVGSNFGPYHTSNFYHCYDRLFGKCTDVCFRDLNSLSLFSGNPKVRYAPDIVLSGEWDESTLTSRRDLVVISPINLENRDALKGKTNEYERLLAEIANHHICRGDRVVLAAFCEHEGDVIACQRIKEICGHPDVEIAVYKDLDFLHILRNSKKIYGSRFHSVILAMYHRVPCVPFIYSPKTYNALISYGTSLDCVNLMNLSEYSIKCIVENQGLCQMILNVKELAMKQFDEVR